MAILLKTYFEDSANPVSVYRADKLDSSGNPRCIVHFLDFLNSEEMQGMTHDQEYALAHMRAKKVGFRKYTAREFGGGFICQYDYCNGKEVAEKVMESRQYL